MPEILPGPPRVVVLHSVQPLTTDVRSVGERVVVLTEDAAAAVRADAPAPPEVVEAPRDRWLEVVTGWSVSGPVEVVTNDEFCLAECARLRAALGAAPRTPRGLDGYLDKVEMKSRLAAGGVAVPPWTAIGRVDAAAAHLPEELGYPLVAKPRFGANSRGVRVLRDAREWRSWLEEHDGQRGWQVERFVDAPMCFVDGLVVDGGYRPVLVGRYLGGLLPHAGTRVLGAVSVPGSDPLWRRAVELGRTVAGVLGTDGRFATHLEFFEAGPELVAMEVCSRAPGALVSELARVVAGHNLEAAHLGVQAGSAAPDFAGTGTHAAWLSVLASAGQAYQGTPPLGSSITVHQLPAGRGAGRFVAALVLLANPDHAELRRDVERCAGHGWYAQPLRN